MVPDLAGERGFGARTKHEQAYGGRGHADVFYVLAGAGLFGVEGVAEGWMNCEQFFLQGIGKIGVYRLNSSVPRESVGSEDCTD